MNINKDLLEFLNTNFPAICEAREKDGKEWEDVIVNIIIQQDQFIGTLKAQIDDMKGVVYEAEQMLNAGEKTDVPKDS